MKDVYVITGATGGMGLDIAKNLDKKGILLLADLYEDNLIKLKKQLDTKGIKSEIMPCNIADEKQIKALVAKAASLGNFKALIHTAGISGSMADAETIMRVNLIGTQLLMNNFYKIADNSVVINFSSMAGHMIPDMFFYNNILLRPLSINFLSKIKKFHKNNPGHAYAFSKKGVIMISAKEATKWGKKNSRIMSLSPGTFETPMAALEEKTNKSMKIMLNKTPVKRAGNPREITNLVKLLLDCEYINGVDILIDGGITAAMRHDKRILQSVRDAS